MLSDWSLCMVCSTKYSFNIICGKNHLRGVQTMNRVQLKTIAKQQLQGNIGMLFVCLLITWVLSNSVPGLASLIVAPPLTLGMSMIFLGLTRNESPEINTLFSGFSYIGPAILLNIMIAVFTCLWSLLFVIPGIIKAISYSMAYFVLADNPELSAKEALDESKRITSGHIGDLFVLYLSFIPWVLLGAITCGLALIYVVPYMQTTMANYYLELKDN